MSLPDPLGMSSFVVMGPSPKASLVDPVASKRPPQPFDRHLAWQANWKLGGQHVMFGAAPKRTWRARAPNL